MMNLPRPRLVFRLVARAASQPRSPRGRTRSRRWKNSGSRPGPCRAFHNRANASIWSVPARCADHEIHAQRRDPLDVSDHGRGRGKIDRDVDAFEILRRDAFEVRVVEFIQLQRDFDAARARPALRSSGPFCRNRQSRFFISKTSGSSSLKNSVCSASTARRRSFSATTTLRFSSDAPCEIMRMLTSPSA